MSGSDSYNKQVADCLWKDFIKAQPFIDKLVKKKDCNLAEWPALRKMVLVWNGPNGPRVLKEWGFEELDRALHSNDFKYQDAIAVVKWSQNH